MSETVLILAGGTTPTHQIRLALPPAAMCIAADSGLDHARRLGLRPDVVVGDLDSVSPQALAWAHEVGIDVVRHPTDKDKTDLELALDLAAGHGPARIVVAGIGGGRFDHLLANVATLAHHRYAGPDIDAFVDTALISVVRGERILRGVVGELVSLLPVGGDVVGVTTTGLRYRLENETLRAGGSRGVSNVFIEDRASVAVTEGVLLAIQPDRLDLTSGGQ
jgi:thiamine pyrophosphokinase